MIVARAGEVLLLLVLMTNFAVLVTDRFSTCIRIMAAQGVLLALLPLVTGDRFEFHTGLLAGGTFLIKAVLLPRVLSWAIREAAVRRELDPSIGPIGSVALGLAAVALAFGVATRLPHGPGALAAGLVPVSLA